MDERSWATTVAVIAFVCWALYRWSATRWRIREGLLVLTIAAVLIIAGTSALGVQLLDHL